MGCLLGHRSMISFSLASLKERSKHRPSGYVEEVLSVSSIENGIVSMHESAYIELINKYRHASIVPPNFTNGVGSELKKLLSKIGITASKTCSCNQRAREMNVRGIDWCKENIDTIVGWLREEAQKRRLPFFDFAGKQLVLLAIKRAQKNHA